MDLTGVVHEIGLGGLYGILFHPDYFSNGYFYITYLTLIGGAENILWERYEVPVPTSYVVDLGSATTVLGPVTDSTAFHGGGGMAFANDGKLMIGIGSRRIEFPADGCTAQDPSQFLGKLMRVNEDGTIPADNPYVGVPGALDSIWALGLRQPYRIDVDPVTGYLYIADIGEFTREEVDVIAPSDPPLQNFGWRIQEGTLCTAEPACPPACPDPAHKGPDLEYEHGDFGCCIIGGSVYRGTALPELVGKYLYTDYCNPELVSLRWTPGTGVTDVVRHDPETYLTPGTTPHTVTSMGTDGTGEILVVSGGAGMLDGGGTVLRLRRKSPLQADVAELSVGSGGAQVLSLDAPVELAGDLAVFVGTASGVSPGFVLDGQQVPINVPDPYFDFMLQSQNGLVFQNTISALDGSGDTTATIAIPAGAPPTLVGLTLNHAAVAFDLVTVTATFASNPKSLTFVP